MTVCGLEKQIEEQESLLKEAYKRIETIEKKLEAADVDTDTIEDFHTNMYNDDTDSFYHSFPAHQIPFQPPVANVSVEFEGIWKDCAESIGQVCKRLRIEEGKKGNHWN